MTNDFLGSTNFINTIMRKPKTLDPGKDLENLRLFKSGDRVLLGIVDEVKPAPIKDMTQDFVDLLITMFAGMPYNFTDGVDVYEIKVTPLGFNSKNNPNISSKFNTTN